MHDLDAAWAARQRWRGVAAGTAHALAGVPAPSVKGRREKLTGRLVYSHEAHASTVENEYVGADNALLAIVLRDYLDARAATAHRAQSSGLAQAIARRVQAGPVRPKR